MKFKQGLLVLSNVISAFGSAGVLLIHVHQLGIETGSTAAGLSLGKLAYVDGGLCFVNGL